MRLAATKSLETESAKADMVHALARWAGLGMFGTDFTGTSFHGIGLV